MGILRRQVEQSEEESDNDEELEEARTAALERAVRCSLDPVLFEIRYREKAVRC